MKISIKNILAIKTAVIEIKKLTIVAAKNFQGKTSIVHAIQAIATGNNPHGTLKKDAIDIVNDNAKTGYAVIKTDIGQVGVEFPSCDLASDGKPPFISPIASGFTSPCDKDFERAKFFSEMLKLEATKEALEEELKRNVDKLWDRIQTFGWDATHNKYTEQRKLIKRDWKNITSEAYGSDKAANWRPEGWEYSLEDTPLEVLNETLVQLQLEYNAALKNQAVSDDEIARTEELAGKMHNAIIAATDWQKEADKIQGDIDGLEQPELINNDNLECPNCKKPVMLSSGKLYEVMEYTCDEINKSEELHAAWRIKKTDLLNKQLEVSTTLTKAKAFADQCEKAAGDLPAMQAKTGGGRDPDVIQDEICKTNNQKAMIIQVTDASNIHEKVEACENIVSALNPKGKLRTNALTSGLKIMTDALDKITDQAGMHQITFDDDMGIRYGGRPYNFCSKSEQLRIKTVFQIFVAEQDGSELIVVDEFDLLDGEGRSEINKALYHTPVKALVLMTESDSSKIPASKNELIKTYWIKRGTVEEM